MRAPARACALVVALMGAVTGCGKSEPQDTCDHVGQRVRGIVDDASHADSLSARQMAEKLSSLHAELARRCSDETWSAETRGCFLNARKMADLLRCDPKQASAAIAAPGKSVP